MIPHVLHCCWFVEPWKATREKYLKAWAEQWPVTLWYANDAQGVPTDIPNVTPRKVDELMGGNAAWEYELSYGNHAACADLFRYEVLYQLGGGYFDVDILPTLNLDEWAAKGDFWVSNVKMAMPAACEIRFMLSVPKHPLIAAVRERANAQTLEYIKEGGHRQRRVYCSEILGRTGPHCMLHVLQEALDDWKKVAIPSPTFDRTRENLHEHFNRSIFKLNLKTGRMFFI